MSVRPIKQVFAELEHEARALRTPEPPREHVQRALVLINELRVSLNDLEYLVKSLHFSILTYDHFQGPQEEGKQP